MRMVDFIVITLAPPHALRACAIAFGPGSKLDYEINSKKHRHINFDD